MRNIFIIIKKELKRFFTDRRMLVSLFLPGIILYLVYSLMGNFMGDAFLPEQDYVYRIGVIEETKETDFVFTNLTESYQKVKYDSLQKAQKGYEEGEVDIVINYLEGANGGLDSCEIIYNSANVSSSAIYTSVVQAISPISAEIKPIINLLPHDTATEEDFSKMMITMLLPLLMLTFLFTGCMAVAPESIAGEKERGTIATLLITPIKRRDIALGKVSALSITALCSAIVSFVAVVLSIPKLMAGASGMEIGMTFSYGFTDYLALLLVIVLTVILFTVILSVISTIAKSVKEATSYATPVMILVMIVGLSGFIVSGEPSPISCLIPIYNTVVCITAIFNSAFNPLYLIYMVISNLAVISLGIFVLAKLFSNERIMFNK